MRGNEDRGYIIGHVGGHVEYRLPYLTLRNLTLPWPYLTLPYPTYRTYPTLPYSTLPHLTLPSYLKAGTEDFMERRMSENFDLDVQGLQDDAPPDTSASLVALAAQLVEVRGRGG